MRKGDFKLVKGASGSLPELHQLLANGTGETVDLTSSHFEKYIDLVQEFVDWEVTLPRPSQTVAETFNLFDRFLYNAPAGSGEWGWRNANLWLNADNPSQVASLRREDSYANLTLIFHPSDSFNLTTRNNISRAAGMAYSLVDNPAIQIPDGFREVVLNQLRFEGSYDGAIARQGNLLGLPLMFTKNLAGGLPQLHLGSQRSTNQSYTFNIDFDLVLHDDLQITGDSDLNYVLNGDIREFSASRSLSKQGTSNLTLAGRSVLRGNVVVSQGALRIDGIDAALSGPATISIGAQGKLSLIRGALDAQQIVQNGGPLEFLGGTLTAAAIQGNLHNQGGTFNIRTDLAGTTLTGDYLQSSGATLHLDISDGNPGFLNVTGAFQAGGTLDIDLAPNRVTRVNDRFQLIEAASFSGAFASIALPTNLPTDLFRDASRLTSQGLLSVWSYADVNADNFVNGLDFSIISQNFGNLVAARTQGDVDGNGRVESNDFLAWQRSAFAQRIVAAASSFASVPEPCGLCLAAACAAWLCGRPRRR